MHTTSSENFVEISNLLDTRAWYTNILYVDETRARVSDHTLHVYDISG